MIAAGLFSMKSCFLTYCFIILGNATNENSTVNLQVTYFTLLNLFDHETLVLSNSYAIDAPCNIFWKILLLIPNT